MSPLDRFNCEEMFRRLDDYVDRELSPDETQVVRSHLEECAVCAAEYQYEESFVRNVKAKLRRIALPPDLRDRISKALRAEKRPPEPPTES